MTSGELLIRNVEVEGRAGLDVRVENGRIAEIGPRLDAAAADIDGCGGALIPGLVDHHIHLLATAARADSIVLDAVVDRAELAARLSAGRPAGAWVRATGYDERAAGLLSRHDLDAWLPDNPARILDRTGALWILNSAALAIVAQGELPPEVERDAAGMPTGRIWRGDAWLRGRIGQVAPPLRPIGRQLATFGVTGVTDASVTTGADSADLLAEAFRRGDLPQRLTLMSGGALEAPADGAFAVGPVKILLDDRDLPPLDAFVDRIGRARATGREVAVHCVTAAELALTLAAFAAAGSRDGDRIEHGGMIAGDAIPAIRALGLRVVTQSGFVHDRGNRYRTEIDPAEQDDLYRCASLIAAGVKVAGSSDAPYAALDCWAAMRTAVDRRTRSGEAIGASERIDPRAALDLYLGRADDPGGPPRRVAVGAAADLCLLGAPLADMLDAFDPALVRATIVGGRIVHAT